MRAIQVTGIRVDRPDPRCTVPPIAGQNVARPVGLRPCLVRTDVAYPELAADFAFDAPPDSERRTSVIVRCGGDGELRPPPPSSRAWPRTPTLIGLGEDGDDFYSRKTIPNLRLPQWNLPREFELVDVEHTPEPFLVTPRPPDAAARYFDREHNRPVTLLDGIDEEATQVYLRRAEQLVHRMQQNPDTRPNGLVATLSAFVDAVWQAISMPVANK